MPSPELELLGMHKYYNSAQQIQASKYFHVLADNQSITDSEI